MDDDQYYENNRIERLKKENEQLKQGKQELLDTLIELVNHIIGLQCICNGSNKTTKEIKLVYSPYIKLIEKHTNK
jgi:hypothetical protein